MEGLAGLTNQATQFDPRNVRVFHTEAPRRRAFSPMKAVGQTSKSSKTPVRVDGQLNNLMPTSAALYRWDAPCLVHGGDGEARCGLEGELEESIEGQ